MHRFLRDSPATWAALAIVVGLCLRAPLATPIAAALSALLAVAVWRRSCAIGLLSGFACVTILVASPYRPEGAAEGEAPRLAAAHDVQLQDLVRRARAAMAAERDEERFRLLSESTLAAGTSLILYDRDSRPSAWAGEPGLLGVRVRHRLLFGTGEAVLEIALDELARRIGIHASVEADESGDSPLAALQLHDPAGGVVHGFRLRSSLTRAPDRRTLVAHLAVALMALGCALACSARCTIGARSLAVLSALSARLVLGEVALPNLGPMFRPTQLAVVTPFHLFSSPGDVLATGLVAGVIAVIVAAPYPLRNWFIGVVSTLTAWALAGAGVVSLLSLLRRLADNAALDLADPALIPFDPVRLSAVSGATLLVLSLEVVTVALARRGLRAWSGGRAEAVPVAILSWLAMVLAVANYALGSEQGFAWPEGIALLTPPLLFALAPSRMTETRTMLALTLAVVASALAFQGAAQHYARRALVRFVQRDLAELMRRHGSSLRWILTGVLADLETPANSDLAVLPAEDAAYFAWKRSRLATESLRAAVDVQRPDGSFARFANRLPVPATTRGVQPGRVTLQDFLFQGRSLRVLAGAVRLGDGTTITLRVGEDDGESRFFPEVHDLAETLKPRGSSHEGWVGRAGAELTVLDTQSRLLHSSKARVFPVDRHLVRRALDGANGYWWSARIDDRDFDAFTFVAGERVLTISLPRTETKRRIAGMLHMVILIAVIATGAGFALVTTVPSWRSRLLPSPGWMRRSYSRTVSAGFTVAALVPALGFAAYLESTLEAQTIVEMEERTLSALEFARRILAEFAAADPLAPIDDSTLIWVAQTVGHDLALFRRGEIQATSVRELFRDGWLSPQPAAAAHLAIALQGRPVRSARVRSGASRTAELRLDVSAPIGEDGLLTLYAIGHRSGTAQAAVERSLVLFLGTASLLAAVALLARWLARRATEPVLALTAATKRIASGEADVRIATQRHDELQTLVDSFNRMAETVHSQRIELRTRAAYLARLLENATTGVVSISHSGVVTTINAAAATLLEREQLVVGDSFLPAIAGDSLALLRDALLRTDRSEIELTISNDRRLRIVVLPLPEGELGPPGRLLLLADVSELVRTKKLEAWAEMARRIAHEIKNPLTPIQLAAEHLRRVFRDGREGFAEVLDSCVSTILRQVEDLRRITREFSAYAATPAPLLRRDIAIEPWLLEVAEPYRTTTRPGLTVSVGVAPGTGHVSIDDARMRRAIVNLIENALHAMPDGGHLEIRARRADGETIEIEVADDGIGIPDDVLPRVFEPYFSTRDAGTGLGLANARRAIEEHGGAIAIASSGQRGTVVRVTLPLTQARA